jgi:hypothetical protein
MPMRVSTKSSRLRTIRIAEDIDQTLSGDSRERATSVNALIGGILSRYAEWDRFAEKTHRIGFPHSQLRILFDSASPEKIARLSDEAATRFLDLAGFIRGSTDLPSLLRILQLNGRYTGLWGLEERTTNESVLVHLYHELGGNYSLFLKNAVDLALRKVGSPREIIDFDNHVVTVVLSRAEFTASQLDRSDLFSRGESKRADNLTQK